ncbi:hypothetical protein VNI00_013854 [Paramarasmius palmivorus]|uniref:F-box protein n=1 Tax=Paramarasmius palmivorus TaxID=297713 RepID=A0AAW0BW62_9AGAR
MQRLCDDIVVDILEGHIQRVEVQGNVELLVLSRAISRRLYPVFYRTIKLWKRTQLNRLCHTLVSYPTRLSFIKVLWICIGRCTPSVPHFLTLDYPHGYRGGSYHKQWICGYDTALVGSLLEVTAPFVERLTIQTDDGVDLLDVSQSLQLSKPTHLELSSAALRVTTGMWQTSRLTHLRLAINLHMYDATQVLKGLAFFEYPSLTHVYLSVHYMGESPDVAVLVRGLETPATVRALVIEVNKGRALAVGCHELWQYDVHPKVVFMVDHSWIQHATHGLEVKEWEHVNQCLCLTSENRWREKQVKSLMLVKTGDRCDIWEEIDIKVRQRWLDFEEDFFGCEDEKADVLAKLTHFVPLHSVQ